MLEWFDAVGYEVDIEGAAKEFGVRPTRFREWAMAQGIDTMRERNGPGDHPGRLRPEFGSLPQRLSQYETFTRNTSFAR